MKNNVNHNSERDLEQTIKPPFMIFNIFLRNRILLSINEVFWTSLKCFVNS